jgi:hypothetical protein
MQDYLGYVKRVALLSPPLPSGMTSGRSILFPALSLATSPPPPPLPTGRVFPGSFLLCPC